VAADAPDNKDRPPLAEVMMGPHGLNWHPNVSYVKMELTVSRPDGSVFTKTFPAGTTPALELTDPDGNTFSDGQYTYELRFQPFVNKEETALAAAKRGLPLKTPVQSGSFRVEGGRILLASGQAELSTTADILHYDDVIITGSLCVGFDCADGESFGFDTIILKEHNLRIYFNDTSYTASYPTNAWRITINDSTNGGASYFAVDDVDDGTRPFVVEAGAPSNSLYVEDYGRVGLGTSTPVVEMHIKDSDTPTVRLEQDSTGGWTAQTFDVAANESNFFIRDATNGSKLPFRIQPSTPSSTLCLKSDGKVGIGTWSPSASIELETTGEPALFIADRTDGATVQFSAGTSATYFGSRSDSPMHLLVNQLEKVTVDTTGYVGISDTTPDYPLDMGALGNNARCTTGGVWQDGSSRASKENIKNLDAREAVNTLAGLTPVTYNYKVDKTELYAGFIAEDVPELVASNDRKALSPMDIVAVLTKVVQEQQQSIAELKKEVKSLNKQLKSLKK
jgi:hypothetical protein